MYKQILYIGNEEFIQNNPEKIEKYLRAIKRATDYMIAGPADAYKKYVEMKPHLDNDINRKIFQRSFRYFSRDLKNVERDWNKVTNYCERLNIVDPGFKQNQTNEFLTWSLLPEGPSGVEPPTVETGVVEGGCRSCQHHSISQPEIFA